MAKTSKEKNMEQPKKSLLPKKEVYEEAEKVFASMMHRMEIYKPLIYNKLEADADIIVSNEGYGDLYVAEKECDMRVGAEKFRVYSGEQKRFSGDKLFLLAGSQPVVSIIEVTKGYAR